MSAEPAGAASGLVDTRGGWFLGRVCGRVDHLKLDRGELAQAALPASAVVLGFDPDHDREAEFLSGLPPLGGQDVLLQQREEALHGGVVAAGTDAAHGAEQAVVFE